MKPLTPVSRQTVTTPSPESWKQSCKIPKRRTSPWKTTSPSCLDQFINELENTNAQSKIQLMTKRWLCLYVSICLFPLRLCCVHSYPYSNESLSRCYDVKYLPYGYINKYYITNQRTLHKQLTHDPPIHITSNYPLTIST